MTIDWREALKAVAIGIISIAALSVAFIGLYDLATMRKAHGDTTRSPSLTLERARAAIAAMGIGIGKQFCVSGPGCPNDPDRYELTKLVLRSSGPDTFTIEVKITPLARHIGQ